MARAVSMYEKYWKLLKKHRGCWLELAVPEEFQARVIKALVKRKGIEHATTANFYPNLEILRNVDVNGKSHAGVIYIKLPANLIDTI